MSLIKIRRSELPDCKQQGEHFGLRGFSNCRVRFGMQGRPTPPEKDCRLPTQKIVPGSSGRHGMGPGVTNN